jgi:hypothetical protein
MHSAPHRRRELHHQQAVAGGLGPRARPGDAAVMLGNPWIEKFAAQRFEALERALLIRPISRE